MNIRSQIQNRQGVIGEPESTAPGGFFLVCLVSFVCHVLFFTSLYFLHDFQFSAPKPRVVTVNLVTFAPGPINAQTSEKSAVAAAKAAAKAASNNSSEVNLDAVAQIQSQDVEPSEPEIQTIKPDVSLKSKPDNLKDLIAAREEEPLPEKPPKEELVENKKEQEAVVKKKLEQDSVKAKREQAEREQAEREQAEREQAEREQAEREQAEKSERMTQDQLQNALERMKASVASKETGGTQGSNSNDEGNGIAGAPGGVGGGEGGGGGGSGEAGPLTLYQMVIKSAIEQSWVFNDAMAGLNKDLEVRIFIKILKSGDIRDISFETRSGNNYLDESAKKAVQRANPLPELPNGMSSYELVLGFSPRGLK